MKKLIVAAFLAVVAWAGQPAFAQSGTMDEAKALATKAAAFLKSNGPDKAFPAFTSGPEWHDRDLYVFVYDTDGKAVAHGGNPALVGKVLIDLKDVDGKPFVRDFVAVKGAPAWVDYKWKNPQSQAVEAKTSYIVPVDTFRVGVGTYKK